MEKNIKTLENGYQFLSLRVGSVAIFYGYVLIFLPKIPLVGLPDWFNVSQGLRFEDLLTLMLAPYFLRKNIPIGKFGLICGGMILQLFITSTISYIAGIQIYWIIFFRIAEYIIMGLAIYNLSKDHKLIIKLCKFFIAINFLVAILQYLSLMGGFASTGYLLADNGWLRRPYGLMGGPWELGVTITLAIFVLMEKFEFKKIYLYHLLVIICLLLCMTRANIIAYAIAIIIFYRNIIVEKYMISISMAIILSVISYIIFPESILRFSGLGELLYTLVFDHLNFITLLKSTSGGDISLMVRVDLWAQIYLIWEKTFIGKLFGIGWVSLYMESFVLRVLFSFGIVGFISIIYLTRNLKLYSKIYLLLSGLTLDLLLSQKIFTFICLYIMSSHQLKISMK